jgi:hypothetical protein
MGKSDFKKINDHWHQDYDSRPALDKHFNDTNEVSNGKVRGGKKQVKRSNHKHDYEKVLTVHNKFVGLGRQCKICGVVRIDKWAIFLKTKEGYAKIATLSEVLKREEYKDLKVVEVKD